MEKGIYIFFFNTVANYKSSNDNQFFLNSSTFFKFCRINVLFFFKKKMYVTDFCEIFSLF